MIDELVPLEINGSRQWLLIRGADSSRPIVLFVHGGPGSPLMWYSRAFDGPLLNDFVVVHWDQRKAGKSAQPDLSYDGLTFAQVVADGLDVVSFLEQRFPANNVILVGHSWGTIVASNMVAERPDSFAALVSVGTCANWLEAERIRYRRLTEIADQRGEAQAIEDLKQLGPPPYSTADQIMRFGNCILNVVGFSWTLHSLADTQLSDAIVQNEEYSDAELHAAFDAVEHNLEHFGPFLNSYVLSREVTHLDVPIYFAEGAYDMNTPTSLSRKYFDALIAPAGKHWMQFDNSAHMPMYEEQEPFLALLRSIATRHADPSCSDLTDD